ncbi:MAG TPA: gamma-glutamylcyclotransferase family protein [Vicinamibacterales bacterium]|jgi:gamma-glutamylcyclotransferase (GGCT)/AIG2-like uncharacterized protein YtfP
MPLLFSYGTLQLDAVQLSTFGRLLRGAPAELVGFVQSSLTIHDPHVVALSGKTEHLIVSSNGREECRVAGTVFEITEEELTKADEYEVAEYTRVATRLASGREAWVYAAC